MYSAECLLSHKPFNITAECDMTRIFNAEHVQNKTGRNSVFCPLVKRAKTFGQSICVLPTMNISQCMTAWSSLAFIPVIGTVTSRNVTVCIVLPLVRYYLKNNMETETLCSDEDAQELLRESQISLLQLSTLEVSAQLSIRDFGIFRNIESTEYVDSLFKPNSSNGHLKQFEDLINEETFWVATEILHEANSIKRMKTIKHFIKIALQCRECNNFNSMFAIIRWVKYNCCDNFFLC